MAWLILTCDFVNYVFSFYISIFETNSQYEQSLFAHIPEMQSPALTGEFLSCEKQYCIYFKKSKISLLI